MIIILFGGLGKNTLLRSSSQPEITPGASRDRVIFLLELDTRLRSVWRVARRAPVSETFFMEYESTSKANPTIKASAINGSAASMPTAGAACNRTVGPEPSNLCQFSRIQRSEPSLASGRSVKDIDDTALEPSADRVVTIQ